MNIADLCTRDLRSCRPETNLAEVVSILWERDCGAVPVLDGNGRFVGVITDRDVCVAVGTRGRLASEIAVKDVMSGKVACCRLGDSAKEALRIMREAQIRRLPVLDENGILQGMVTVGDIIRAIRDSKAKKGQDALLQEVILTLMAISQRHSPRGLQVAGTRALSANP